MNESKIRAQSPVTVSWFEFLLNPTLLERHLTQKNPEPLPIELIINFLSNCTTFGTESNANGMKCIQQVLIGPMNFSEDSISEIIDFEEEEENKKNQALKLLTLKVAAFLKWDVNLLEKKLPLSMQHTLLSVLLRTTGNEVKSFAILPKNGKDTNKDASFARVLYYTWILRAFVEGSYPSKNQRGLNLPIPGQIDPSIIPPAAIEAIMRKLHEEVETATSALEEFVSRPTKLRMPVLSCFGSITDECLQPIHKWEQGINLKEDETVCQVSYALGRYYFFQEKYDDASRHFIKAAELFPKIHKPVFCNIYEEKLKGFYSACSHLLGYQKSDINTPLKDSLNSSINAGHQNTVQILRTDNIKKELPLALRDTTEINVLKEHSNKTDLLLYVTFANALRRTLDGEIILLDWYSLLKVNEERSSLIICELLKDAIPHSTNLQKACLKNFVGLLCLASIPARVLLKKFEVLSMLLNKQELNELLNYGQQISKKEDLKLDKSFTDNTSVQVGSLERKLLSAEDASTIKLVVAQLRGSFGLTNLCSLNRKWEPPKTVSIFLNDFNIQKHVDQEVIQILLAKANELCSIKNYGNARHLFLAVEGEIRNYSPRLSRYVNWEILRLDLLEILDAPVYICQSSAYQAEIAQRILSFLSCHKHRDFMDMNEGLLKLMELCAVVLLNFREWDKIIELGVPMGGYFEFARVVSIICKDVFGFKSNRNVPREMWDAILSIFCIAHLKRPNSGSGLVKESAREFASPILSKVALQQFIRKLKDTSCLGVIISCLTKFYNILKDDSIGEIFLEYQTLWPTSVTNAANFNIFAVSEAFQTTLQHALSIHPTHSAWLRAKGDVMYVQGHYSTALKYYLSAAMVSTDYFYLPLPRVLFDDMMFKHMIHCCTKLHNHTQAAVLHQFLDDPSYPCAFKALSERVCNDSCDSYYQCIWDVTLLEYLINMHSRRGELEYRGLVMNIIGQLELNSNNNEEIQREAANLRKGRYLRALSKQFL